MTEQEQKIADLEKQVANYQQRLADVYDIMAEMRDEAGHPRPGWPFAGYAVQEYWAAKHAARFWQLVKALGVAELIIKLDTEHAEQIAKAAQMKRMPG